MLSTCMHTLLFNFLSISTEIKTNFTHKSQNIIQNLNVTSCRLTHWHVHVGMSLWYKQNLYMGKLLSLPMIEYVCYQKIELFLN